jgi:vesicle coat complex subunit
VLMKHLYVVCYLTFVVHDNCCNRLLMSVIKGCLKEENKELKKLVMIYWEVRGVTAILYVRRLQHCCVNQFVVSAALHCICIFNALFTA